MLPGPLAVIAFGFVACKNWCEQGWEMDDNPVATAFEIFWMFFEPMLFAITGAQVVVSTTRQYYVNFVVFMRLLGTVTSKVIHKTKNDIIWPVMGTDYTVFVFASIIRVFKILLMLLSNIYIPISSYL